MHPVHKSLRTLATAALVLAAMQAHALSDAGRTQLERIQARWAEIHYQTPAAQRDKAFEELARQAGQAAGAEPQAAELHIWNGIVLSTWAGAKGGLGALGLVKQARSELELALRLDDKALDGSAYTSLGSLYYQVPGWPVAFGDDDKAEAMLKKALSLNPDGLDPNYFYGDFLQRKKRWREARAVLEKALAAPARPGRATADAGRRDEVRQLLKAVVAQAD
jgi:tetratricopeptide (TPR) repeat protein